MWDDFGDWVDPYVDPQDGGGVATDDGGTPPITYDDGSVYYPDTGEIFDGTTGDLIGTDSGFGDGSWYNLDGALFNADNQWVPDIFFEQDAVTGQWYDTLTGTWYDDDGKVSELQPRDPPGSVIDLGTGQVTDLPGSDGSNTGVSFLDKIGNALKNIFGGEGGGGSSGGSQASSAAQQRQQQAQNALQKAQASGTASATTLATLQRQLAAAQAAVAATSGGITSTILIAGAVGLGVYAITRRRD